MKRCIWLVIFWVLFAVSSGFAKEGGHANAAVESVYTDLTPKACKEIADQNDPNNTPYRVCPGVSGYALIVRHSDAGRYSIDVVTPRKAEFSLAYSDFITRYFFHLGDKAEWRVLKKGGRTIPIALIIRVESHENDDEPQMTTHSYLAVAKITSEEICLTDRILAGSLSPAKVYQAADSAKEKECLKPQPPRTFDQ